MKICYVVYREDNVMVFDSQVLLFLKEMKTRNEIDGIELIVFRHNPNLTKKKAVEDKIHMFVDECKTFASFPVLSKAQLDFNAFRLKHYVRGKYEVNEQIAVICRGELATYMGAKAFASYPNSRVLFDNRGLPLEESEMRYGDRKIHVINRKNKRKALDFAKSHCDMYNFVTNEMRKYLLEKYSYKNELPYTIIPTLYHPEDVDWEGWERVVQLERYTPDQMVVSYIGSTASWQSTSQLISIIEKIGTAYKKARFIILTNGEIEEIKSLPSDVKDRLTVKGVPHSQMKYYLKMSDFGIVIRDENIVNQVAAPTKIAEYLTAGVSMLYAGNIGILRDIKDKVDASMLISVDQDSNWIVKIDNLYSQKKKVNSAVLDYFDMKKRQSDTIQMIQKSFDNEKVK